MLLDLRAMPSIVSCMNCNHAAPSPLMGKIRASTMNLRTAFSPPPHSGIVRFADGAAGAGEIIQMGNRFTCCHAKEIGSDGAAK
jgi:hypothetical protein